MSAVVHMLSVRVLFVCVYVVLLIVCVDFLWEPANCVRAGCISWPHSLHTHLLA